MMNTRKFLLAATIAGLVLSSCSDDDDSAPIPVNAEEVITTATLVLTNASDDTDTVTLESFDADGADGPTAPVSTIEGTLSPSTTYTGIITLLNETEDPAEVINEEIEEESDEHQFFYIADGLGITSSYTDQECDYTGEACDGDATRPVGLEFELTTTEEVGDVALRVVLRHLLDKDAAGVSDGDIANAGGDTDIDVTFDATVE